MDHWEEKRCTRLIEAFTSRWTPWKPPLGFMNSVMQNQCIVNYWSTYHADRIRNYAQSVRVLRDEYGYHGTHARFHK